MDNSTRLQYLEAMGIDVWVSRKESPAEQNQFVDEAESNVVGQMAGDSLDSVADSWVFLQNQVAECEKCILSETRRQTVFGEGDVNAEWMLVGEAPSKDGEMEGKPFSGQSGFLLIEMLRAMGLKAEMIYSTNIIKCSPPDNKDPKVEALKSCADYLQRQIALVKPKIILAVGRIAAQALLGTKQPLSELREQPYRINGIPVVVTYHPAYLLRSLPEKRKAWQDLQLALKIYQQEK